MMKLISRAEAKQRGLKRYFTGNPCKHGHMSEWSVVNYTCMECSRTKRRKTWVARYQKNIEAERERGRKKYHSNKKAYLERSREWQKRNPDKKRASFKRFYDRHLEQQRERVRTWCRENKNKTTSWRKQNKQRVNELAKIRRSNQSEIKREKERNYNIRRYLQGPQNPKDEAQWLRKAQAQLRNLKRLLRHPNRDHSSWLNEAPRP